MTLTDCVAHAGEVRYDLTVRGELLLRGGKGLLVAPGKRADVVLTARDGSGGQRWTLEVGLDDTGRAEGQSGPQDSGRPAGQDSPGRAPKPPGSQAPERKPGSEPYDGQYEERFAQVDRETEPSRPPAPLDGVRTLPADALGTVTSVADRAEKLQAALH